MRSKRRALVENRRERLLAFSRRLDVLNSKMDDSKRLSCRENRTLRRINTKNVFNLHVSLADKYLLSQLSRRLSGQHESQPAVQPAVQPAALPAVPPAALSEVNPLGSD